MYICCLLLHASVFTSLLHAGVEVIVFFTLTCKCNSILHACVEAGDEAHPDPHDLFDQGAAPSGRGSIGWLRIQSPWTGSVATGHPTSLETCRSGTDRIDRASPRCTAMA
jgi:hypothetical protein